jgi:ketosteroid isomerase-like protein
MDRATGIVILDRLHAAPNAFYGGGDDHALRVLLDSDITWTVPGSSPIAGIYRGANEVFGYFTARHDRAAGTFRMHRRDVLTGEGARIAAEAVDPHFVACETDYRPAASLLEYPSTVR